MQTLTQKRILQDFHKKTYKSEPTYFYILILIALTLIVGIAAHFSIVIYQQRNQMQMVSDLKIQSMKNGYACSEEFIQGVKIEHCIRTVRKF